MVDQKCQTRVVGHGAHTGVLSSMAAALMTPVRHPTAFIGKPMARYSLRMSRASARGSGGISPAYHRHTRQHEHATLQRSREEHDQLLPPPAPQPSTSCSNLGQYRTVMAIRTQTGVPGSACCPLQCGSRSSAKFGLDRGGGASCLSPTTSPLMITQVFPAPKTYSIKH